MMILICILSLIMIHCLLVCLFGVLTVVFVYALSVGRSSGGRCHDDKYWHQTNHTHGVHTALDLHRRIHVQRGVTANRLEVHVAKVAEVEQIVVNELPGRVVVVHIAAKLIGSIAVKAVGGRFICGRAVRSRADPYPKNLVTLAQRVRRDAGLGRDTLLPRNLDTLARRVEQRLLEAPVVNEIKALSQPAPAAPRPRVSFATDLDDEIPF